MRKLSTLDGVVIVADCDTRNGREKFTHTCKMGVYDTLTGEVIEVIEKVIWKNRTWEEYPFQKVLKKAAATLYTRAVDDTNARHASAVNKFYSTL